MLIKTTSKDNWKQRGENESLTLIEKYQKQTYEY